MLPTYARSFPLVQCASACDTARAARHCVGFSGTNGSKGVLPVGVEQCDLEFVLKTNDATDAVLRRQQDYYDGHRTHAQQTPPQSDAPPFLIKTHNPP